MIEIINIGSDGARRVDLEFKKHPHSIVKVHHPECGHCKAMEKDWTGLEEELKKNYNGDIGIITVHSDAISNTNIPALKKSKSYTGGKRKTKRKTKTKRRHARKTKRRRKSKKRHGRKGTRRR